jgi:hypothetical protein
VAFHLNNGHIYDEAGPNLYKWRGGGKLVAKNTCPRVIMTVDRVENVVRWKVDNQLYG